MSRGGLLRFFGIGERGRDNAPWKVGINWR